MFFVILGVVILVVSFVVALVSLLREQNKLDEEVQETKAVPQKAKEVEEELPKPSLSDATNGILSDFEKVQSDEFQPPAELDRQSFPWEEAKKSETEDQGLPNQEEIERIRKEIQSLRKPKANEKPQVVENAQPEVRNDLSGEVSISDLRKGTDRF